MANKLKYKKEFSEQIIELMAQGLFDEEICAMWCVSRNRFYQWLKEYPDLKEGYDIGWCKCFQWWMTKGKQKFLDGDNGGQGYWNNVMTNKFHWNGKSYLGGETNININNMNVLPSKTSEEYIELITDNLPELDFIDVKVIESSEQNPSGTQENS